jgi:hypothetical protein
VVVFVESAFKHGYEERDFFELMETGTPEVALTARAGNVYELLGRNYAGEHLHVAYRREVDRDIVFHMRAMSPRENKELSEGKMKTAPSKTKRSGIRLPRKNASYAELSDFFDRHDAVDLLDRGIMEVDPDRADLERMLREYWNQPNTKQLNIRIPPSAKHMIERLAKRKTVEVSTLVRIWVIESMRREAALP